MFAAFRRAKALSVVKTMLDQTLAPLTIGGRTIPSSIYEDPYVLGYLMAVIGFGTELATQRKLSVDDVGRVSIDALNAIAGTNGRLAVENAIRFSSEKGADFREGQRQANRLHLVAYGLLGPKDDPEIAQLFALALEGKLDPMPGMANDPKTSVAAFLGQRYFCQYLRTKHQC
jgi:hypothetical protein